MIQPEPAKSTQGTHRTPRATRTPNPANHKPSITIPPSSDNRERDEIHEVTLLSLAIHKTTNTTEEQENMDVFEEKISQEDVEKIVEGKDEESYASEFADTKDDKKDDDDDNYDDHDDHALIKNRVSGSSEIRTEKMQTPIPSPPRSPRKYLSSDKAINYGVFLRLFEKSSASFGSCRDDAFRKRDHDNDQRDDAPHEMEKSAKRKKDILKFKRDLNEPPRYLYNKDLFTLKYGNPEEKSYEEKKVMDLVKIVKFCDATLEKVLKEVKLKIFETEFLKKAPLLGDLDLKIIKAYKREITKHLRHRKQMGRGESFMNGRPILSTIKHE
nr:hypothetical protein [Tanacetum cinerariifolium]